MTFFEESKLRICKFILLHAKNSWRTAMIELGSLLETIFQSERSTSELAGPGNFLTYKTINLNFSVTPNGSSFFLLLVDVIYERPLIFIYQFQKVCLNMILSKFEDLSHLNAYFTCAFLHDVLKCQKPLSSCGI